MARITLLAAVGAGYVLGTRAGRERYAQIASTAQRLWRDPRVQQRRDQAADAARSTASEAVRQAGETARGVAGEAKHRAEEATSGSGDGAATRPAAGAGVQDETFPADPGSPGVPGRHA